MAVSSSTQQTSANPAFISVPFPSSRPRCSTRSSYQRHGITCCATKDDQNDSGKRDSISEWVARARSQGRARRARASNTPNSTNSSSNRAGAASALDAVDRLFGGNDSTSTGNPELRSSGQSQPISGEQRKQWLNDLRRSGSRQLEQSTEDENIDETTSPISSARQKISRPHGRRKRPSPLSKQFVDENLNSGFAEATVYDEDDSNGEEDVDDQVMLPSRATRSRQQRSSKISTKFVDSANNDIADMSSQLSSTNRSSRLRSRTSAGYRARTVRMNNHGNNQVEHEDLEDDVESNLSVSSTVRSTRARSASRRAKRKDSKTNRSATNSTTVNTSFSKLLEIARSGGIPTRNRSRRPDFESLQDAMSDLEEKAPTNSRRRKSNAKSTGRSSKKSISEGPIQQLFDMSRSSRTSDARKALVFDDTEETLNSDEETFDNGNSTLRSIGIKVAEKKETRRKYSATRRVGGRLRKINAPPADWAPMTSSEIATLRSDKTPLVPRRPIGAEPVRHCAECYGTGLEMCSVCVGTGWVAPLHNRKRETKETKHDAQVRRVWEQPNLCIHKDGSAQCPCCNGIGKSLCSECEGSGSALRKGFDPADKYIAFDMFQGGSTPLDNENFEVIDDKEFVEVVEGEEYEKDGEEEEEDLIYSGTANGFEFTLPHLERSTLELVNKTRVADDQYEEPEFEFPNGVYDEEHTDFGSKPQRKPLLRRVKGFKDDYIPFSGDRRTKDESAGGVSGVRLVKSKIGRTTEPEDDIALVAHDVEDEEDDVELESSILDVSATDNVLDEDEDDLDDENDIDDAGLDGDNGLELEEDNEFLGDEDEDGADPDLEPVLPIFGEGDDEEDGNEFDLRNS